MAASEMTIKQLARETGIAESTLGSRIGKGADIGSMRLSELWAIEDCLKRRGVWSD